MKYIALSCKKGRVDRYCHSMQVTKNTKQMMHVRKKIQLKKNLNKTKKNTNRIK